MSQNSTSSPFITTTSQPTQSQTCCNCTTPTPRIAGCPQDTECEDLICDTNDDDKFCCDVSWDELCAEKADIICETPSVEPTKTPTLALCCACTEPKDDKGCDEDPVCEELICRIEDSYCCDTEWDQLCALGAQLICPSETSEPTSSPTVLPTDIMHPTTETPSLSPTNVTFTTETPSISPTNIPTYEPTSLPTKEPTLSTLYPTINPTDDLTLYPTEHPTNVPNLRPSNEPTIEPTLFPSDFPTLHPTPFDPTIDPTLIPSTKPTIYPTNAPTMKPTVDPTLDPTSFPTNDPTKMECELCDVYWVKLTHIEFGDKHASALNCRFRGKIALHPNKVFNDIDSGTKVWYIDDTRRECSVMNNEWGQRYPNEWNTNNKEWSRNSDDYYYEDDDIISNEICLTYSLKQHSNHNECDKLQAVFLPLCDRNSYCLTANDLDSMISTIHPRKVKAKGAELHDTIGIMIYFTKKVVDEFKICLKDATIDDHHEIPIANRVIFKTQYEYQACSGNDGLPCIKFEERKECDRDKCLCRDGIKQISAKYIGNTIASKIIFYHDLNEICVFFNVEVGQEIMCSLQLSMYSKFKSDTEYIVIYEHDTDCKGAFDTSCSNAMDHNFGFGPCYDLQLIKWKDVHGRICEKYR